MKRLLAFACALATMSLQVPATAGQPSARIGDATTPGNVVPPQVPIPGTIVPPGAPTVLICGKPAARVGDMVVAAMSGPITAGSPTVLIEGKPAARTGDVATNGAKILNGCATVLIGP